MQAQLINEEALGRNTNLDLPEHLIAVPREPWALWRWVCLRSAGFPVTQVLEVASAESAAAADNLLDAEERLERTRLNALELLRGCLDTATAGERGVLL